MVVEPTFQLDAVASVAVLFDVEEELALLRRH